MTRLSLATLDRIAADVTPLAYDRATVSPGIVHLGIGAFHRAHQAVYTDDLLATTPDWGIVGASLRRPDTHDALTPQDGLYTLAVRDEAGTRLRVIGAVLEVIDANAERERLIDLMASPETRIVSMTVTEKGYCHDPATGLLDEAHPDIVHDLADPHAPVSVPGLIVEALDRRRHAGTAPFAVMSCDNLPNNGMTARRIVCEFAALRDPLLSTFVADKVAFPSTMVDRIVPATTDADRAEIEAALGLEDAWPVVTEPFTQWVIEDNFPAGRPQWEAAGAQIVADVTPFEHMKLRMLNGAHSTLAYLGYLSGFETVSEAIGFAPMRTLVHEMMTEEVMPTLDVPDTDLGAYRDALIARFANPALKHRTWQICMDGSQKLPQRLLGTIGDQLAAGRSVARLTLGVAAWMRYVMGVDEAGAPIDVRDPLTARLRAAADEAGRDAEALVASFLRFGEIFGTELPADAAFREQVTRHLDSLLAEGARATIERVAAS